MLELWQNCFKNCIITSITYFSDHILFLEPYTFLISKPVYSNPVTISIRVSHRYLIGLELFLLQLTDIYIKRGYIRGETLWPFVPGKSSDATGFRVNWIQRVKRYQDILSDLSHLILHLLVLYFLSEDRLFPCGKHSDYRQLKAYVADF